MSVRIFFNYMRYPCVGKLCDFISMRQYKKTVNCGQTACNMYFPYTMWVLQASSLIKMWIARIFITAIHPMYTGPGRNQNRNIYKDDLEIVIVETSSHSVYAYSRIMLCTAVYKHSYFIRNTDNLIIILAKMSRTILQKSNEKMPFRNPNELHRTLLSRRRSTPTLNLILKYYISCSFSWMSCV